MECHLFISSLYMFSEKWDHWQGSKSQFPAKKTYSDRGAARKRNRTKEGHNKSPLSDRKCTPRTASSKSYGPIARGPPSPSGLLYHERTSTCPPRTDIPQSGTCPRYTVDASVVVQIAQENKIEKKKRCSKPGAEKLTTSMW